jgi:CubicO group peptidase (beta-lactamase class C family)
MDQETTGRTRPQQHGWSVEGVRQSIAALAQEGEFSGVVRLDQAGTVQFVDAYGLADRAFEIPNTPDTTFAIASGVKGFTALVVMSLVERGVLSLDTPARRLLGADLPLIDDAVTVADLLAHRSGIGDYVDEESDLDVGDYVLPVPVHQLVSTENYLTVLEGHTQKFPPGERFSYCNSGYVVLALISERVSTTPFDVLVRQLVCEPANMANTAFLRSDELPGNVARGYLAKTGLRTNLLHLPVKGNGDGGLYTTVADIHSLWQAIFDGLIVSEETVAEMTRAHSESTSDSRRYGLGFWLHESRHIVSLVGHDAGVSFRSTHDPVAEITHTVVSNTSDGARPISKLLDAARPGAG